MYTIYTYVLINIVSMAATLVTFFSRSQLIEGNFAVSLNGKVGRIKIELVPKEGTERVIGLTVSMVTVEIPYFIPENDDGNTNTGYVPPPTSSIKREALNYFNRFIDVLRWKTRKFWIRPISEFDISYMEITKEDNTGKKRGGFSLDMGNPSFPPYPMNSADENILKSDIVTLLENESPIAFHDMLFLESINQYQAARFDEAVITMNIALESFTATYLSNRLRKQGNSEQEVKKKIDEAFSTDKKNGKTGMRKAITKYFEEIDNRSLEHNEKLWKRFEDARDKRALVIHPKRNPRAQKRTLLDAKICLGTLVTLVDVWKWIDPSAYPPSVTISKNPT
jgi:hypothetical protein